MTPNVLPSVEDDRRLNLPDDDATTGWPQAVLSALGRRKIRLISNNPDKESQLTALGAQVVESVRTGCHINPYNDRYLLTKVVYAWHRLAVVTQTDS